MLVAFGVLLLLTLNLFTSLISMVSIGAVVTCVIGTIVAVGWSLGIIESISLSIVTGLAVDYSGALVLPCSPPCVLTRPASTHGRFIQ